MVQTTRASLIGQQVNEKKKKKSALWYDNALDVVTENADTVREEDVTIAVESFLFAMELRKKQEENTQVEYYEEDFGTSHSRLDINYLRHRESKASMDQSTSHRVSLKDRLFPWWKHDDDASDCVSEASSRSEGDQDDGTGLFGVENSGQGLLNSFFANRAKSDRLKRFIAFSAWIISLAGLIASLTFLTRDFVRSTRDKPSVVQYERASTMDLPIIFFCIGDTNQPFFSEVPEGYSGDPIFWIDYVKGTSANIDLTYPDTKRLTQISFESIETSGRKCNASSVMDVEKFASENHVSPSCFHCLSIQRNPALTFERTDRNRENVIDLSSRVAFRFSRQAFVAGCRMSDMGMSMHMHDFFRQAIQQYSKKLVEKQILDFGGLDPLDGRNQGLLFPTYRMGGWNTSLDLFVYDVLDMYCNTYMFSGHFYPTKDGTDIRYKFDRVINRWGRFGKGPYHPPIFDYYFDSVSPEGPLSDQTEPPMLGAERYDNRSLYMGELLYIVTNATVFGVAKTLAVLDKDGIASIAFSRTKFRDEELYETRTISTGLLRGDARTINHVYFVDLKFTAFFTRIVKEQQAMGWTAFLADFFGLTSLFLDISVYTILISPISGRKAPGQQKSRNRADSKAQKAMKAGYAQLSHQQ